MNNKIIVFTKPWQKQTLEELAVMVKKMGFDGVELPVREDYQVTPKNVSTELVKANKIFNEHGLKIVSIAGSMETEVIEAMGKCGIGILRICYPIDMKMGYTKSEVSFVDKVQELQSVLLRNKVKIGLQNHFNDFIGSAIGLEHALSQVSEKVSGAVLDFAHCGLAGERIDIAYDIIKKRNIMINMKNAFWFRLNGPDEEEAKWEVNWVTARHGLFSWKEAISILRKDNYEGIICITAEYNQISGKDLMMDDEAKERTMKDLKYLKELLKD